MSCTIQQMLPQAVIFRHTGRDEIRQPQAHGFRLDPEKPYNETTQHRTPIITGPSHNDHDPDDEGKAQGLVG